MVVDEQDVDAWFYIPVLEGVVEQYDIDCLIGLVLSEPVDAAGALAVDSNGDVGELLLHLIRLIADHAHGRLGIGEHKSVALTFIAATEHSHVGLVFQQSYQILYMGCLASATDGDVANGDDGYGKRPALQDTHLKEHVPEADAQTVKPAQRAQ